MAMKFISQSQAHRFLSYDGVVNNMFRLVRHLVTRFSAACAAM
jgi:hypothetical protein